MTVARGRRAWLVSLAALALAEPCMAASPADPRAPAAPPALPDPATYRQEPAPVPALESRKPSPVVEVGAHAGVAVRPSDDSAVTYAAGPTVGGHAKLVYFPWLGLRLSARHEWSSAEHEDAAPGGTELASQALTRIVLGAAIEPTWAPVPRLEVFGGLGIGWGRTSAEPLEPVRGDRPSLPRRSAVFVELPLSLGAGYEVIPDWLVVSASGSVSLLTGQSGNLLESERTPGPDGSLQVVEGLPEMGPSWALLAGLGLVL